VVEVVEDVVHARAALLGVDALHVLPDRGHLGGRDDGGQDHPAGATRASPSASQWVSQSLAVLLARTGAERATLPRLPAPSRRQRCPMTAAADSGSQRRARFLPAVRAEPKHHLLLVHRRGLPVLREWLRHRGLGR
jgi:hypothetical protein